MNEKKHETMPGDGLRSLRSTALFRTINYELYVKPNRGIMIFGSIAILGCTGYLVYMRQNSANSKHFSTITTDGTIDFKRKTSKWSE